MNISDYVIELTGKIKSACKEKDILLVAIDGRCASGKTTLAERLKEELDCNVIHTDDFYLQKFQRTPERYDEPGGNLDRERLEKEILAPLRKGEKPVYRPFNCNAMSIGEEKALPEKKIYVIEGTYSCHPQLRKYYDITIILDIDSETQKQRLLEREGEKKLKDFIEKWIPLEEKYFSSLSQK